jgi:hypothetical protein
VHFDCPTPIIHAHGSCLSYLAFACSTFLLPWHTATRPQENSLSMDLGRSPCPFQDETRQRSSLDKRDLSASYRAFATQVT